MKLISTRYNQLCKYLLLSFILNLTSFNFYASAQTVKEKIDQVIAAHVANPGPFSGTVLVAQKGEVVYRGAFGNASLSPIRKNQIDTKYFIASITKQMTTVAILQLVESGRLHLHDKLSQFLPQINRSNEITIHELLSHRSGLARDSHQAYEEDVSPLDRVLSIQNDTLTHEPSAREAYSNTAFYALTHIIEKLSGLSYEEYLKQHIFEPAKMFNTGIQANETTVSMLATGLGMHLNEDGVNELGPAQKFNSPSLGGGGSLYSTVDDQFRFFQALESGKLVSQETVDLMKKRWPVTGEARPSFYHSYGWEVWDLSWGKIFDFTGRIYGYVSMVRYFQKEDIYVVLLCNSEFSERGTIAQAIRHILLGGDYNRAVPKIPASIPITASMKKHEGEYDFPEEETTVEIKMINGKMTLRSHGDHPIYLLAEDKNTFYSNLLPLKVTFEPKSQMMVWQFEDQKFELKRK